MQPLVGDGRPRDVAAESLERVTLEGGDVDRRVETKAHRLDAQIRSRRGGQAEGNDE